LACGSRDCVAASRSDSVDAIPQDRHGVDSEVFSSTTLISAVGWGLMAGGCVNGHDRIITALR
jgi:hypothetical protein